MVFKLGILAGFPIQIRQIQMNLDYIPLGFHTESAVSGEGILQIHLRRVELALRLKEQTQMPMAGGYLYVFIAYQPALQGQGVPQERFGFLILFALSENGAQVNQGLGIA